MTDFKSLEPAVDPSNRITFLLDWELTLKCNLDCSYCETGIHGGHDNSIAHPPLHECLETIDFMYKYVDLYMSQKPKGIKYVILNMYGGESLYHPDIVEILAACRDRYLKLYQDKWHLTVTTTTNAIISKKRLEHKSKLRLKTITIDTLIKLNLVDIITYNHWVIDLQGAELLALQGAEQALKTCNSIYIEVSKGDVYQQGAQWEEVKNFLKKNNFFPNWDLDSAHSNVLFTK
jgi:uncharacterized radical SAM superfamily Fe-S cluster-containing enzyme